MPDTNSIDKLAAMPMVKPWCDFGGTIAGSGVPTVASLSNSNCCRGLSIMCGASVAALAWSCKGCTKPFSTCACGVFSDS